MALPAFSAAIADGTVTNADQVAVGAASAQFTNIVAMAAGQHYMFCSNIACWIKQGLNPTASAAPGSMYVPANVQVDIDGGVGIKLAVIQDAAGGKASLTRMRK